MTHNQILSGVIQVVIAIIASSLLIQLFLLRQNRRKIAGEASSQEANAASTLSGAALQMVESARDSAHEADKRSENANTAADKMRKENTRLWRELNLSRWEIYRLQVRERMLEQAMAAAGLIIPPTPTLPPDRLLELYPPPDPSSDASDL